MFRDEHLGRAVALHREFRGMAQVALAKAIGVTKSTMNGYERGSRGMDRSTIERISSVLECDSLLIWDDAYKIFRYNYLLERAQEIGVTVEEMAARLDHRPSLEQIQKDFQALHGALWQVWSDMLAFLKPDRYDESSSGVPVWGVVVAPRSPAPARKGRALQLRRGRKARVKSP